VAGVFLSKNRTTRPARATAFRRPLWGYLADAVARTTPELRRAMVYGSVMGSFAVEKFGLDRLRP